MDRTRSERVLICSVCGKEFKTIYPNVRYCSLSCREKGRIQKRQKWKTKNPDYYHKRKKGN